jgi:large subunit ribosomal protein L23
MNPLNVLIRPILSEKSNLLREATTQYTFEVATAATKTDVKKAIAKQFGSKVVGVRTIVCRGKVKRRGMHVTKGKTTKKAIVTLAEGEKLKLFEDQ